jgi:YD repeat-containing protein
VDVELPGLVVNYQNDETFVAVVRQAFLDAGGSANPDGLVTADTAAFDAAFVTVATAAGIDPADLLLDREAVTVDVPVAAGTPPTSGFVADPVCTATGHFLEVEEDFTWPERLAVLRWRRTYSSRFVAGGPFGRGWASWATCALVEGEDGAVGYAGPDGQMAVFVPSLAADDPPGSFARVSGVQARLERDAVSGWALRWDRASAERGGQVWRFDADGLIREVTDPARGTVSFAYDGGLLTSVAHEGGRALTLEWDGARVVEVRGSCGRAARYRYDDRGDLVGTERVVGDRRYEVDADGRVVEVWDADGVRLCRNTYDDEGRVLAQVSPFGREVLFRYHLGNRTVVSDTEVGRGASSGWWTTRDGACPGRSTPRAGAWRRRASTAGSRARSSRPTAWPRPAPPRGAPSAGSTTPTAASPRTASRAGPPWGSSTPTRARSRRGSPVPTDGTSTSRPPAGSSPG